MQQQTTAENELRLMIGDLFMQLAMLRAENASLKSHPAYRQAEVQTNGKEAPDADHRSESG